MSEEYILHGLPVPEVPDCSFAEYVLPRLRSFPRDKVLVVDGETGEEYTVWQFLTNGLQLLKGLKGLAVKQTDVVALLARNSFEANDVMLACWLGAIPVAPVNGFMKVPELRHSLGLLKPKVVFCEEVVAENVLIAIETLETTPIIVLLDRSEDSAYTFIKFEDLKEEVDVENYEPEPLNSPSTHALVIPPSSGTSGLPKAIELTHRNLIFQDHLLDFLEVYQIGVDYLQVSHFYWITGIIGLLRGLTRGTRRVFVKNINAKNILSAIDLYKANFSIMAPLSFLGLIKSPEFHEHDLTSLKFMVVAGSPLTPNTLKAIKVMCPDLKIHQVYGLTETGGITCCNTEEDMSVGKLCAGVSAKIIDSETGKTLQKNERGEICIKCPGIMKGYIGNEESTKECLDEDGWLHTGDIGYYDEEERIFIVDRIKEMIKVRNMQIAPAEVENVISSVPGVLEVGVVGLPNEIDGCHVVALVNKRGDANITEDDIHAVVQNSLSDYKHLTGGVFFVDAIPKTHTGKVNRNQLRVMAKSLHSQANQS